MMFVGFFCCIASYDDCPWHRCPWAGAGQCPSPMLSPHVPMLQEAVTGERAEGWGSIVQLPWAVWEGNKVEKKTAKRACERNITFPCWLLALTTTGGEQGASWP